jgi:hypothetical protein
MAAAILGWATVMQVHKDSLLPRAQALLRIFGAWHGFFYNMTEQSL